MCKKNCLFIQNNVNQKGKKNENQIQKYKNEKANTKIQKAKMSKKTKQKYQYYYYILKEGDKREHILCQISMLKAGGI